MSVGVTVISGFLGGGKTTLVSHLVRDRVVGPGLAVLVNELDSLGLDGDLIAGASASADLSMVELSSGCICCTLRGELGNALFELAAPVDRPPPKHILLEASGAALAGELAFQVSTLGLDAPFHTEAVVTLVDAAGASRAFRDHPDLFTEQVARADLVLVNKIDLASPSERAATEALLARLAPGATKVATVRAEIDPQLLLGLVALPRVDNPSAVVKSVEKSAVTSAAGHGFKAVSIPIAAPLTRERLEALLESMASRIFRIKGVVDIEEGPLLVQCVGDYFELTPLPAAMAASERRLIFIGADLDRDWLARRLMSG